MRALEGRRVVVQSSLGLIYAGEFKGTVGGFVILASAEVKGQRYKAKTPFLAFKASQITHIHLEGEVEELGGG